MTDRSELSRFAVTRWRRYGHDRLYFSAADGTKYGHFDLATGATHAADPDDANDLEALAHEWCHANQVSPPGVPLQEPELQTAPAAANAPSLTAQPEQTPASPTAATPTTPVTEQVDASDESALTHAEPELDLPAQPEWTDLAGNIPGHSLRIEAAAEWEAAKSRSKIAAYANRYVFENHTQERAWRAGAEGEEYIGPKLNKLRKKGWRVLHSVPVGNRGADIDHVVIGPGGVFTVNTKNHAGKKIWVAQHQMRVNGRPVPYLRNSSHEAARAKRLLESHLDFDVPVLGCVVVLTGTIVPEVTYKQMPEDVRVLDKWDVPRWFRRQPRVFSEEEAEAVYEIARRSTTWN